LGLDRTSQNFVIDSSCNGMRTLLN
jgi:hypothetical protein